MSLIASKLQPFIAQNVSFDRNEDRPSLYGVTKAFLDSVNSPLSIFNGDLQALAEKAPGTIVKMPYIDHRDVAIGSGIVCAPAAAETNANLYTFTRTKYSFPVTMYPAQYAENYIAYEKDFNRKISQGMISLMASLEAAGIAVLEANKNQFWTGVAPGFYTQVANSIQVSNAAKNDFYNQLNAIFMRMDFTNQVKVISNVYHTPTVNYLANQGNTNATNLNFQLNPYQWYWSNFITNGLGIQSSLYAFEEGSLGIAFTKSADSRMKNSIGDHKIWFEQDLPVPGLGYNLPFSGYYQSDCADGNAATGRTDLAATKFETWQFMLETTLAFAYNSAVATRYNPCVKAEITVA